MNQDKMKLRISKETIVFLVVVGIVLVTVLIVNRGYTIEIGEFESVELANISYVMAGMATTYESVIDVDEKTPGDLLAETNSEQFITNIDFFNYFLDISTLYFDRNDVFDNLTLEELQDSEFDYRITYQINNLMYEFYFIQYRSRLDGKLIFDGKEYLIEGSLELSDGEIGIDLDLRFGSNDVLHVSYHNYLENETNRVYYMDFISFNSRTFYEVHILDDLSETQILVRGAYDDYMIKEISSLDGYLYEVEYVIDDVEGVVYISVNQEDYDEDVYEYIIHEDGEISETIVYVPNNSN